MLIAVKVFIVTVVRSKCFWSLSKGSDSVKFTELQTVADLQHCPIYTQHGASLLREYNARLRLNFQNFLAVAALRETRTSTPVVERKFLF